MKISLNQNLKGRVKKVKTRNFLVALFEAVSNSIHAIEDSDRSENNIKIEIFRAPKQPNISNDMIASISGFKITDNGSGFDERNMKSFKESDSTFKESKGGKGVGRFTWLKFFEKVDVTSSYEEEGKAWRRSFSFSLAGLEEVSLSEIKKTSEFETTIDLNPLKYEYEKNTKKSLDDIAISLIEHFLAYLVTKSLPQITLIDGAQKINLIALYNDSIGSKSLLEKFKIDDHVFNCIGIRNYIGTSSHSIFLCGNKRVAEKYSLSKKDRFFTEKFLDKNLKGYSYHSFVESDYLDEIVNDDREGFRFPENGQLEAFDKSDITKNQILEKVCSIIHGELKTEIEKKKNENRELVEAFVMSEAPQYRCLLKRHQAAIENIHETDPVKLDLALRKIQFEEELENREELDKILKKSDEKTDDAKKEWKEKSKALFSKLSEDSKAKLAGYIVQRKSILDLLKKRLEIDEDKYAREEAVHQLIFPMRSTSDDVDYEDQNLWVLDERLSYHYYLASDKPLSTIPPAESDRRKEPDIVVFNRPIALSDRSESERIESVVIIEFKRPGESSVSGEKNPVDQVLEYIELIKEGRATTRKGRPMETNDGTYFFGYVVCEIDENFKKVLTRKTMRFTSDGRGMFGFFDSHQAYIEVISYDKMLDDAQKRNRILFDKLQIPPQS